MRTWKWMFTAALLVSVSAAGQQPAESQPSTQPDAAAATQTGTNGRIYTFQGWSNQGSASQGLTIDQSMVNNGYRLTATYSELSRVVVQSLPSGLTLQVDGASCVTPCNRPTGDRPAVLPVMRNPPLVRPGVCEALAVGRCGT